MTTQTDTEQSPERGVGAEASVRPELPPCDCTAECGDDPALARGQAARCSRWDTVHAETDLDARRYRKVRRSHPRLEVRYWTGTHWEPLTGGALDAALDSMA